MTGPRHVRGLERTRAAERFAGPWRIAVVEGSMLPAIESGDWLLVDPTVGRWPRRGRPSCSASPSPGCSRSSGSRPGPATGCRSPTAGCSLATTRRGSWATPTTSASGGGLPAAGRLPALRPGDGRRARRPRLVPLLAGSRRTGRPARAPRGAGRLEPAPRARTGTIAAWTPRDGGPGTLRRSRLGDDVTPAIRCRHRASMAARPPARRLARRPRAAARRLHRVDARARRFGAAVAGRRVAPSPAPRPVPPPAHPDPRPPRRAREPTPDATAEPTPEPTGRSTAEDRAQASGKIERCRRRRDLAIRAARGLGRGRAQRGRHRADPRRVARGHVADGARTS